MSRSVSRTGGRKGKESQEIGVVELSLPREVSRTRGTGKGATPSPRLCVLTLLPESLPWRYYPV